MSLAADALRLAPWWYSNVASGFTPPLGGTTRCDVAVIGGGFAGLHAALRLAAHGVDVVLLEKTFCGGGSSGKSSGFLTPDSELELHDLIRRYGMQDAAAIWQVPVDGVALIVETAKACRISCDLEAQDSLFVGVGTHGLRRVLAESEARRSLGYPDQFYSSDSLRAVHPGGYAAGVRYAGTYVIDPFAYCQGLKAVLLEKGVRIHERTEVLTVRGSSAVTSGGTVDAERVVVCIDKMSRGFHRLAYRKYYHAQTYLAITRPLLKGERESLFPEGRLQCWDSKLVYTYYRMTGDGRLLLGGGWPLTTFSPREVRSPMVIRSVIRGLRRRFSALREADFLQYWPGMIDITRDLLPVADADPHNPAVYYVMGCAGLPWAAWCGDYAARRTLDPASKDYSEYFGWERRPFVPDAIQQVISKPPSFALDYLHTKYG